MDRRLVCAIVCGLLWSALLSIAICLGVFTAKSNEFAADHGTCVLFYIGDFYSRDYSICQYATWGSATAMMLTVILEVNGIILAVFKYTG